METESEGIKTYQGDGEGKATCCSIMGGTVGKRGGSISIPRWLPGRIKRRRGGGWQPQQTWRHTHWTQAKAKVSSLGSDGRSNLAVPM